VAVLIVNLNTTTVAFNLNTLNPRRQFKPWPVALRRGGMFDLTANQLASTLLEAQQLIGASPDALFFLNRKTIGLLDTVTGEAVNPAVPPTASVPTQEIPVARLLTDVEVDQGFVLPADAVGADLIDASTLRVTAAPEPEAPPAPAPPATAPPPTPVIILFNSSFLFCKAFAHNLGKYGLTVKLAALVSVLMFSAVISRLSSCKMRAA
jgi:hypothetical protein